MVERFVEEQSAILLDHQDKEETLCGSYRDVTTICPGQSGQKLYIRPPDEELKRNTSAITTSINVWSATSTRDIEAEVCAHILEDGVGHRIPRRKLVEATELARAPQPTRQNQEPAGRYQMPSHHVTNGPHAIEQHSRTTPTAWGLNGRGARGAQWIHRAESRPKSA